MASTEELEAQILADMESDPEAYAGTEIEYCTVDDDTRVVTVPEKYRKLGVESDEAAKRVWFRFPKLVGNNGIDLSAVSVRVNFRNANGDGDIYMVQDLTADGDNVVFSWELSRKVTAYKGSVSFVVCAVKSNTSGVVKNEWNTTLNRECEVLEGLEVSEQITQENPDIIEYILANLGGSVSAEEIATAVEEYMVAHPFTEIDPTVPEWAKQPQKPTYTASEVGAEAAGTADGKVSAHNTAGDAHNDIRKLISGLTQRLNALADSDDTTLDQMSEVVAYIKSNKSLIDAITTSKINVADIIDNLTTNVSNKPLSAAQGVALKALIDGITIPEKLPNPQKLTFAGAVTAEYDGSGAVTVTIPEGSGGKSAYQYAQDGGYTGTETEFSAKLAQEKFANPNALTFTGAVSGTYDGAEALTVEIPSGGAGGGSEYELLCDRSFDLDGTGTPIELSLPASPKGFVLYLGIQVDSPATSDIMTFSVDGATVPSYFNLFNLTTSKVTVKKWFCDSVVTENLMYMGGGDSNSIQTAIKMVRGNIAHMAIGSPTGDGKLVVGVPEKVGKLYIRAYMRY